MAEDAAGRIEHDGLALADRGFEQPFIRFPLDLIERLLDRPGHQRGRVDYRHPRGPAALPAAADMRDEQGLEHGQAAVHLAKAAELDFQGVAPAHCRNHAAQALGLGFIDSAARKRSPAVAQADRLHQPFVVQFRAGLVAILRDLAGTADAAYLMRAGLGPLDRYHAAAFADFVNIFALRDNHCGAVPSRRSTWARRSAARPGAASSCFK